jgi:hypothetical protein
VTSFLKNPKGYVNDSKNIANLYIIHDILINAPKNFDDCLEWSRKNFEQLFTYSIRDIVNEYPEVKY